MTWFSPKVSSKRIFNSVNLDEIPLLFIPKLLILNLYLEKAIFGSISTILMPQFSDIFREY